ncbi:pentatricopeptide repeat-containing protein At3g22690-like [Oryza glaberrima]|uniref:pentatricopeptide repeat-containing protein At3g22690-like n=1 Tax=Oryza glaberrima TaxID=4538 RepID=UPI00023DECAA|nr:pentatricopeptide repeat-containing protein At3g22690-like [Oryza glaberrima]XP_052146148.1 pentatricopeptide repeat-containing protein At3g22690-like [Oryza glaberrima]
MRYLYFHGNASQARPIRHHLLAYLDACASRAHLAELHGRLVRAHLTSDSFVAGRLIALLASPAARHDMRYARKVFDGMAQPNAFVWNCMIRGYSSCEAPRDALAVFREMRRRGVSPDNYTMAAVVSASAAFAGLKWRSNGDAIHALVRRIGFTSDVFVMSGLVNYYGAFRSVEEASKVFEEMYERDVVSWTSMISACAQCDHWDKVLKMLSEMQAEGIIPNKVTIISLLSACGQTQAVDEGRWVYNQVGKFGIEADVDIRNALISMYTKCGCLSDALEAFQAMPARYTKSWNTLIDGFVQNHEHKEALRIFEEMLLHGVTPDGITLVSVLSACAQLGELRKGMHVHSYIKDNGICCDNILTNSLINMYAKCGDMAAAERVFQTMTKKDVVSWTVMVCGYVKGHQFTMAFNLFEEMKIAEVVAHEMALVSLLSACSQLGALGKGREIHSYIEEMNVAKDLCLESALVDMYAKCGCIDTASEIFRKMQHKQTLSWNAMIGGLASNGYGKEAVELFDQMLELQDPKPDGITLKAVLGACAHVGMVDEGLRYFYLMSSLGVVPDTEHYGCIVDLLGRAGMLDKAFHFIKKMPIEPNPVIWGSLLAACRVHHRMDLGKVIGQHIVNVAPNDVGVHVLVSNLHAEESQWDDVEHVRGLMGSRGIEKTPGHSSVQV